MRIRLNRLYSQEGFTILEILVATTIGLFLVLILGVSIVMGLFLVQKGENWTVQKVKETSVMESFYQQVAMMRQYAEEGRMHFQGAQSRVVFVTPLSLTSGYGKGLVEASYSVIGRELSNIELLYQERRLGPGSSSIITKERGVEGLVLLKGCNNITFEYLLVEEGRKTWVSTWQEKAELPQAVSLRFGKGGKSQRVIAPVLATSLSLPSGEL